MSEQEYLREELRREVSHEYVAGQIFAMAGAIPDHNRIALNIASRLLSHLRGGPCQVFVCQVKVYVASKNAYYYPDVVVTCEARDRNEDDPYVIKAPALIIEVFSPSTEAIDRREKLLAYQSLDSLQEYVLIAQSRRAVEIFRRHASAWEVERVDSDESFALTSVDLHLRFDEVYEGCQVPAS